MLALITRPPAKKGGMLIDDGEVMTKRLDATEARQGETRRGVRYVLVISLAASVAALAVVAAVMF